MENDSKFAAGAAFLAIALYGCIPSPRKPFEPVAPAPNAVAIYFYRPSEMTGRLLRPTIAANNARLGRLANDSCAVAFLPPGEVRLRSTWPGIPGTVRDDSVVVAAQAGKTYYLRVRYHVGKPRTLTPSVSGVGALAFEDRAGLEEVAQADAAAQMAGQGPCETFVPAPSEAPSN